MATFDPDQCIASRLVGPETSSLAVSQKHQTPFRIEWAIHRNSCRQESSAQWRRPSRNGQGPVGSNLAGDLDALLERGDHLISVTAQLRRRPERHRREGVEPDTSPACPPGIELRRHHLDNQVSGKDRPGHAWRLQEPMTG